MELKDIKPDEKLIKFRKTYREQIDGWYNGSLHVAIIYSIGGLLMFHYVNNINNIIAWELIIIPVTLVSFFCMYFIPSAIEAPMPVFLLFKNIF